MNRIFVNEFRLLSIVVSIYCIGGEFAVLQLVMQRGNSKQQQKTVVMPMISMVVLRSCGAMELLFRFKAERLHFYVRFKVDLSEWYY